MDLCGNPDDRDPISPFIQLLWDKGTAFEKEVIESLKLPFENLRDSPTKEKEKLTLKAMEQGRDLIYGGRIRAGNLLGEPDLLRRRDNKYEAIDIKSGAGLEGESEGFEGRPKKHYAVQLALYTDILERIGLSAGRCAFIWDVNGKDVKYELDEPQGKRTPETLWNAYESILEKARKIVAKQFDTLPALSAICKLCHWRSVCTDKLEEMDDLTLIPELGRSRRDALAPYIKSLKHLITADFTSLVKGDRTIIPRVSPEMLFKFQARAKLQKDPDAKPYLKESLDIPSTDLELFYDIETDPMRDICYLHGFVERRGKDVTTEKYIYFFAENATDNEEKRVFADALDYVETSQHCAIYYYSSYEKAQWCKLQKKYPQIVTEGQIEEIFSRDTTVDLYHDVVKSNTEWPTRDYSIKTLAKYLGFKWRDTDPSGAASIEWYNRWMNKGDESSRSRILEYNEDDCRATRVLLDGIQNFEIVK
jgi:uncharacterized protein